jgi:hypothetical protein
MGGGFTELAAGKVPCDGDDVRAELNDVFLDPTSPRYKYAKKHNSFASVEDVKDNYLLLIGAYSDAGVDVCAGWGAYLRRLGRNKQGRQDIVTIAETRDHALKHDLPMETVPFHDEGDATRGREHVKAKKGSTTDPKSTVDSPFPLSEHP